MLGKATNLSNDTFIWTWNDLTLDYIIKPENAIRIQR